MDQQNQQNKSGDQAVELLTKLIRVIANIATDGKLFPKLIESNLYELQEFLFLLVNSLELVSLEQNEEFVVNSISCLTNVLFFDIP